MIRSWLNPTRETVCPHSHHDSIGYVLTQCSVLSHLISQLRPGADLSRVVLPTFILEPRSMLERITKYASAEYYDMLLLKRLWGTD